MVLNPQPADLYAASFILMPHDKILETCRTVNEHTKGQMDVRPTLTTYKTIERDHRNLFDFFKDREFLQIRDEETCIINTKLDDEWAINVFSSDVDLLATGIYKFDDVLKGGFRAYRLPAQEIHIKNASINIKRMEPATVLLQGRPGSGKTTMGLQMLSHFAAQGYSSLYVSTEQSLDSLKRTIRRFCTMTQWSDDRRRDSAVAKCRLLRTPENDRTRFASELVERKDDSELSEDERSFKWRHDESKHAGNAFDEAPTLRDFFVVVWRDDLGQSERDEIQGELQELLSKGWHGVFVSKAGPKGDNTLDDDGMLSPRELERYLDVRPEGVVASLKGLRDFVGLAPSWIAIDSITAFEHLELRGSLAELQRQFKKEKLSVSLLLLTEHLSGEGKPTQPEVASDMIIELGERQLQIAEIRESASNYMQRYLEVKKCRLAPFHRGKHPIAIKSNSVKVYRSIAILLKVTGKRRRKVDVKKQSRADELLFGIEGLDGPVCLNGSVKRGSVTVITGPPGSHKTGISAYFLAAGLKGDRPNSKSVIYSLGGDRRSVMHGLSVYIDAAGKRICPEEVFTQDEAIVVRDIYPGYLFPEAFVEDLIDTLGPSSQEGRQTTRVVFDSFDSVHAAFPIMRMDQFLWKVIFQVCWDYGVSALVKVSELSQGSEYYHNMAALVTSMADNIIRVNERDQLRIVESESGGHTRSELQLETEHWHNNPHVLGLSDVGKGQYPNTHDERPGILLRVRRSNPIV